MAKLRVARDWGCGKEKAKKKHFPALKNGGIAREIARGARNSCLGKELQVRLQIESGEPYRQGRDVQGTVHHGAERENSQPGLE